MNAMLEFELVDAAAEVLTWAPSNRRNPGYEEATSQALQIAMHKLTSRLNAIQLELDRRDKREAMYDDH